MDVRKFGKILIALGLLAVLAGGYTFIAGREEHSLAEWGYQRAIKEFDKSGSLSAEQHWEHVARPVGYAFRFAEAETQMSHGKTISIGGGLVLVLGIALLVSARKPQDAAV